MKRTPEALTDGACDLLIIGGGITGAGVALDAATRGLRVALIDKGDFASGTSSLSSKLIHGGLRYLEHGDFHLVYEALHERGRLLRNAPHLVHPLRFVLPFYDGARVPAWQFRIGLVLYDVLAGGRNIRRSRANSLSRLRHEFPGLRPEGLRGGAEYFDAQMDDARLCLEVLRTAALHGAILANYIEAVAFDGPNCVRVRDHRGGREFSIAAKQVLNATGPWGDAVRRLAGDESGPLLRPTKGVHLIAADRGLRTAFLLLHPADGRVFFVLPWLNKTLLGTTDTVCEDSPDELRVTPEDVAYLLEGFNHYFMEALSAADVLGSFAGLRPLIRARPGEPSDLSREFQVHTSPSGLLTAAGGKYTTYRHMAEIITDTIVRRLGLPRRCRTRSLRLDGAPDQPWEQFAPTAAATLTTRCHLDAETARHLVGCYGRRALEVADYLDRDPALRQRVVPGEPVVLAEFAYQRDHEMALIPADFLLRRTRIGLFHPELLHDPPALLRSPCDARKTAG
ncbi:MAG TPA: glycerol-3-phosphate dehydrogenase [Gemmataceae bacterium]|nr:glycerol-3-phosphate dehydrogenase [Gemmataceae bacterium]